MIEKKLPEGWEWQKLKNISEINPKFDKSTVNGDIDVSFIPMSNVEEMTGKIDLSQNRPLKEVIKGYTPLRNGDLLFAKITPCMENGKIAVADGLKNRLGFASTEFHVIRFGRNVIPDFYRYYLLWEKIRKQAEKNMTGSAGQKRVPTSFIQNLVVPVPPPETQRKIVAILEKAEATQRLRAEADALTQQLLQNVYMSIFGDPISNPQSWDIVKLECVCKIITDGEHATPKRSQSGIYLLSARNIRDHEIDLSDVDYIDDKEYDRISKRIVPQNGDVLISCSGSVGRVSRVKDDIKFQMVRSVALIRPDNQKLNSAYLEYAFDTTYLKMQIAQSVNQSSQANLFQGKIRELKIPLPPMDLQQIFADIVEKYEQLTESQRMTSRRALTLYSSLLSKAFTGELIA